MSLDPSKSEVYPSPKNPLFGTTFRLELGQALRPDLVS